MQWLAETVAAAAEEERYRVADSRISLVAVTMFLGVSSKPQFFLWGGEVAICVR